MGERGGRGKVWPVLFALCVMGALAFWQWFVRTEVVTYGTWDKTFFKLNTDKDIDVAQQRRVRNEPVQVTEGDDLEICFAGLVWYRLCHGTLSTYLTPTFGSRFDFSAYTINTPFKAGPVVPKCRKITAPMLNGRQGPFTFGGHAHFTCWMDGAPDVQLPTIKLDILKKSG